MKIQSATHTHFFLILLFFSVLRPIDVFGVFNLSMVAVTLVLLFGLTCWSILRGVGIKMLWQQHKFHIVLFALFQLILVVSLFVNQHRYQDFSQLANFGVVPVAVWSALPMALLLFYQPVGAIGQQCIDKTPYIVWAAFMFLAWVGIWQFVHFSSSTLVTDWFVAADYSDPTVINSIVRMSTDFGSIMALASIYLLIVIARGLSVKGQLRRKALFVSILLLFIVAGLLSGSRNFVLTLFVGIVALLLPYSFSAPKKSALVFVVLALMSHIVILSNAKLITQYGDVLPYISKIDQGEAIQIEDFKPTFSNSSFDQRRRLWVDSYNGWQENLLLGVSNGGFKLRENSRSSVHNTHNFIVQTINDGGIAGGVTLLALLLLLLRKAGRVRIPLIAAVMANLSFDFYLDHSLPWIVCIAWLLINAGDKQIASLWADASTGESALQTD